MSNKIKLGDYFNDKNYDMKFELDSNDNIVYFPGTKLNLKIKLNPKFTGINIKENQQKIKITLTQFQKFRLTTSSQPRAIRV